MDDHQMIELDEYINDQRSRLNKALAERDAAYAVLARIVKGWDGPPHKATFQRAIYDARELLSR